MKLLSLNIEEESPSTMKLLILKVFDIRKAVNKQVPKVIKEVGESNTV